MNPEGERPKEKAGDDEGDEIPDHFVVTTELDLHGLYPEQVPPMLEDFLENAREKGYREVKIIHGKGKSRMKKTVLDFLEGHPLVESYRDAYDSASGWGATTVRVRS